LSKAGSLDDASIRKSIIYGSILASFVVEDFSMNRLLRTSMDDISRRYDELKEMTKF
jgi:hypothetical protein